MCVCVYIYIYMYIQQKLAHFSDVHDKLTLVVKKPGGLTAPEGNLAEYSVGSEVEEFGFNSY